MKTARLNLDPPLHEATHDHQVRVQIAQRVNSYQQPYKSLEPLELQVDMLCKPKFKCTLETAGCSWHGSTPSAFPALWGSFAVSISGTECPIKQHYADVSQMVRKINRRA